MKRIWPVVVSIIALILLFCIVFYLTRPTVLVLTEDLDEGYLERLHLPSRVNSYCTLAYENYEEDLDISGYDLVLDYTLESVSGDNVVRPVFDYCEMLEEKNLDLSSRNAYLFYDEEDQSEVMQADRIVKAMPSIVPVPFKRGISESEYAVYSGRIAEASYLLTFNLADTIGLFRSLGDEHVWVLDYLDSASICEKSRNYIPLVPDWKSFITSHLENR